MEFSQQLPSPWAAEGEESGVTLGLGVREEGQARGLSKAASREGCCPLTCGELSPFLLFLWWVSRVQQMERMHHF